MRIDGREITEPGADRMMIFQEFDQLLPWKTVLENVMFPLLIDAAAAAQGGRGARPRLYREGRPHPRRRQLSAHAVRRHEAARRDRARHGDGAGHPADGRAVRRARRADAADCRTNCCSSGTRPNSPCCSSPTRSRKRSRSATASCCCRRIPAGSRPRSSTSTRSRCEDGSAARLEKQIHDLLFADDAQQHIEERAHGRSENPAAQRRGGRAPAIRPRSSAS